MKRTNKSFKVVFDKPINIKIDDIQIGDFYEETARKMAEALDKPYYDFLTKNGYKIDKPYNTKQIEEIKKDLAKQDKFLDKIERIKYEGNTIKRIIIPFFNCISNPLSEEQILKIIDEFVED